MSMREASLKSSPVTLGLYLILLAGLSAHLYRTPLYTMDSIQYMGNALLLEDNNVFHVHARVYAEMHRSIAKKDLERLLGHEPGTREDQDRSLQARASDPAAFGEFLPFFAIRPLYNRTLYWVSKMGLGLVKAGILISAAAYFVLGVILFFWVQRFSSSRWAALICLLTMASPPLMTLGRLTTSDALSSAIAFAALYLIFEKQRLAVGMALLLASIYFRTDFIALAGPVILLCWLQKKILLWQGVVLSVLAVGSVLYINHFAGDYGIKMLYYRNFVGTPSMPAEMHVRLSLRDYIADFRSGLTLALESFLLPFLVLGAIALRSKAPRSLLGVAFGYLVLHFLILPNWQERWVGVFYLAMVVGAAMSIATTESQGPSLRSEA